MKRFISILCIIALLLVLVWTGEPSAKAAEYGGICGEKVTWHQSGNKLIISGTGSMYDYSEENKAPWAELDWYISSVVIESGVTSIGDYAFRYNTTGSVIRISGTVTSVGRMAFAEHGGSQYYLGNAPEFAEDAFYQGKSIIYTANWDAVSQQNYGGNPTWKPLEISLNQSECLQQYGLGEQLDPTLMTFQYSVGSRLKYEYIPRQVTFGDYDNSTYGKKSVQVTADGYTFAFTYMVTDGTNHLDSIRAEFESLPSYYPKGSSAYPNLFWGDEALTKGEFYDVKVNSQTKAGLSGTATVTGKGILAGFQKTFYFPVLKSDKSNGSSNIYPVDFTGKPVKPGETKTHYERDKDYVVVYENNVNVGTATMRVIGINDCYGEYRTDFEIRHMDFYNMAMKGNLLGTAEDEELSNDWAVYQSMIPPTKLVANTVDSTHIYRQVFYQLYRITADGGQELVTEQLTGVGDWADTRFEYDFSYVYEDKVEEGGEVFTLYYSWVNEDGEIYGGVYVLMVASKLKEASSMRIDCVENDGDFRKEYLSAQGDDGTVGEIVWTSANPSIATVDKGVVTIHKPGTTQVTAKYGQLTAQHTVVVPQLDLTSGIIFDYNAETGARVIWDDRLLEEGTDYTLSVSKNGDGITVTATGCGLFTGELKKTFDGIDSLADRHTHSFTNSCDGTCNGCDYTRGNDHTWAENWSKDQQSHWHACTVCGEKEDEAAHTISPDNDEECLICGKLWIPGDMDGNGKIDNKDVEYLLW